MNQGGVVSDEERRVKELRKRMKGKMSEELFADDDLFTRFLRARNLNIDASEDMLTKHVQWRKTSQVDKILKEYKAPEVYRKFFPFGFMSFDKDGCPIAYSEIGNLDIKGLWKCAKKSEFSKFVLHHLEEDSQRLLTQSKKLGKKIDKWTYVFNFDNFSLASATDKKIIEVLIYLVKVYDANYPERLKRAYIINASFYFTMLWSIIKPFLAPATTEKVKIFGRDSWLEEMKQVLGAENLPICLGGNLTDSHIVHGGTIPDKYYARRDRKSFSRLPGVKRLEVNCRSKARIRLEVYQPGSSIEWDFDVKKHDIMFAVVYEGDKKETEDGEEIVPKQKIDTIIESESGMIKCEKPGSYILLFDNSYSWMHNKTIWYSANVVNPSDVIYEDED